MRDVRHQTGLTRPMIKNGTMVDGCQTEEVGRGRAWLTIMKHPANEGHLSDIKEMLPLAFGIKKVSTCDEHHQSPTRTWFPILIMPLHPEQRHAEGQDGENQADGSTPPDERVSDEVILDLVVAPAAHPETLVQPWPLGGKGGEDVFLVGVGDEGVVGGHHGDVQVPEVAEERRFVELHVARWYCQANTISFMQQRVRTGDIRRSFQWLSTFQYVWGSAGLFSLSHETSTCLKPQGGRTALAARM